MDNKPTTADLTMQTSCYMAIGEGNGAAGACLQEKQEGNRTGQHAVVANTDGTRE